MKDKFFEFYKYTQKELDDLWENAYFVFDANVLLNLYRYSDKPSKDYLRLLKKIKERSWLPHQIALEYHRNRLSVIREIEESYKRVIEEIKESRERISKKLLDNYPRHPFLDIQSISTNICRRLQENEEKIKTTKRPNWFKKDPILEDLTKIFNGRVGEPYDREKLKDIFMEGEERYKKEIPPGYLDVPKDKDDLSETKKFGDLISWYQIIDYSKEIQKPIILITEDRKEDWWQKEKGKTVGPRHELIKEIYDQAGVRFHMYNSDTFLKHTRNYFKEVIEKATIEEVEEVGRLKTERKLMDERILEELVKERNFSTHRDQRGYIDPSIFDRISNERLRELDPALIRKLRRMGELDHDLIRTLGRLRELDPALIRKLRRIEESDSEKDEQRTERSRERTKMKGENDSEV